MFRSLTFIFKGFFNINQNLKKITRINFPNLITYRPVKGFHLHWLNVKDYKISLFISKSLQREISNYIRKF